MASTNKTPNLNLPQWQQSDKPEMADFNNAFSKVDTTVATHLAESASKHITESGSNANGRYIKFDDGTMICYFSPSAIKGITDLNSGSVYGGTAYTKDFTWTFPAAFINTTSLAAFMSGDIRFDSLTSKLCSITTTTTNFSNVQAGFRAYSAEVFNNIYKPVYYAIGRWK